MKMVVENLTNYFVYSVSSVVVKQGDVSSNQGNNSKQIIRCKDIFVDPNLHVDFNTVMISVVVANNWVYDSVRGNKVREGMVKDLADKDRVFSVLIYKDL